MTDANKTPPEGFVRRDRRSPVTDPWEPIYTHELPDKVVLGIWLKEAHCNARGFAHGGLISAFADNGMGHSCVAKLGGEVSLVTVNLSVDFIGSAQIGQWLEIDSDVVKAGRKLCFAECKIRADGKVCGRATSTFMVV